MKREEATDLLHTLKHFLNDQGFGHIAGMYEDVQIRFLVSAPTNLPSRVLKEWADTLLPPGKMGRVRLTLSHPTEARALVVLVSILRSIED